MEVREHETTLVKTPHKCLVNFQQAALKNTCRHYLDHMTAANLRQRASRRELLKREEEERRELVRLAHERHRETMERINEEKNTVRREENERKKKVLDDLERQLKEERTRKREEKEAKAKEDAMFARYVRNCLLFIWAGILIFLFCTG